MPKVNIHITNWRSMPDKKRLFLVTWWQSLSVPPRALSSSIRLALSGLSRPTDLLPSVRGNSFFELGRFAKAQAQFQRVSWRDGLFVDRFNRPTGTECAN